MWKRHYDLQLKQGSKRRARHPTRLKWPRRACSNIGRQCIRGEYNASIPDHHCEPSTEASKREAQKISETFQSIQSWPQNLRCRSTSCCLILFQTRNHSSRDVGMTASPLFLFLSKPQRCSPLVMQVRLRSSGILPDMRTTGFAAESPLLYGAANFCGCVWR
jgi:hypothetical protein